MAGTVIYEAHPAMFRAHPFWFILSVLLIAAFGIGILILLYWYIQTRATALTVTDQEIMYEQGHPEQGPHLGVAQADPLGARRARASSTAFSGSAPSRFPPPAISRNSR